jgi:hypothetical protein
MLTRRAAKYSDCHGGSFRRRRWRRHSDMNRLLLLDLLRPLRIRVGELQDPGQP